MDLSGQLRAAFTTKVLDVLDRAAIMRAPGRAMGTLDVFLALVEADAAADWQRIWLNFRELHEADAGRYRDPSPHDGDSWNSRPVTGTCARAIRAAVALAGRSAPSLLPVSTGVLALCLVGTPVTAASRALVATAGPAHHLLLELAQEALVGSHWADIESVLGDCFDASGPGAPGGLDLDDEDPDDEDPDVRRLMEDPDVRRLIEYRADMMEALFATLREFLRADTLGRSGALLEQHPELLGADANAIIETSIRKAEQIGDFAGARHMREKQRFLESYRQLIDSPGPNAAPAERAGECAHRDHVLTGSMVEEPGYTSVAVRCGRCHVGYLSDLRWEPGGEAHVSYHVFPADGAMEPSREVIMWAVATCEESIAKLEQTGAPVRKSTPVIGGHPESLRRHTDFKPISPAHPMSALEKRLRQFEAHPRPGMVLDPAAQAEAAELLASAGLRADIEVLRLAGALHFLRWMAHRGEEADWANQDSQEELMAAMALFAPLFHEHKKLIPKPARRFLARVRGQKPGPGDPPAMAALRAFLTAKRPGAPAWAALLWNLSLVLYRRYERVSQVPALSEAIAVLRHAVQETPRDDPEYPRRAAFLGSLLLVLHKETSQPAALDEALELLRLAPAGRPGDENQRPAQLSALGSALHALFSSDSDLDALSAAVRAHRDAVGNIGADDPRYGPLTLRLAAALLRHYKRTGQVPSLDEAIEKLRLAYEAASRNNGFARGVYAALSNNLSVALTERYECTKDTQDLDEAIAAGESAVRSADGADELAAGHGTLGIALLAWYVRHSIPGRGSVVAGPDYVTVLDNYLRSAREHLRAAVTLTPGDSPAHATALANLGIGLLRAQVAGAAPEVLDEAGDAFCAAADSQSAAPPVRARACLVAGRLAADRRDWHAAAGRLTTAIDLLEKAVPRGLRREDREYQLSQLRDLGCDAAACAWRAGDTDGAVALFERGRGVLLAQEMGAGTELERLRAHGSAHTAKLAERFRALQLEMERAGSGGLVGDAGDWTGRTAAEQRRDLLGEWDDLLAQIRDVPGFAGFLRPPPRAALLASGSEGPVVLVNVSKYGSAAFLIRDHSVTGVELPDLTPATVRVMVAELLTVTGPRDSRDMAGRMAVEQRLEYLLGLLWDTVAGPVLDRLGMTARLDQEAAGPRIWWCPSGLLSFLPLHAAGYHATRADACPQTVMDRVTFSYIPTIAMLQHARRAPARPAGPMLIVAPGTVGTSGLMTEPAAAAGQADATVLADAAATPNAVLSALKSHGRVHFACHAASDLNDPSTSFLELYGQEHLAMATVAALRLANAEFAFLAACSTYQGGTTLADEAIHLGGAFHLAGYRHVVATLWPIKDSPTAGEITRAVHQGIAGPAGTAATAASLHHATRRQRDRVPFAPSLWAPYVHSGS